MKKAGIKLLPVLLAILFLLLNGCAAPSGGDASKNSQSISRIGEAVVVGDFEITVESFEKKDSVAALKGVSYFVPTDGYEFISVNMTVKNLSDKEKTFASIVPEFVVYSNGGKMDTRAISFTFTICQGSSVFNRLDSGVDLSNTVLAPLESKTGFYTFSIPQGSADSDTPLTFRIQRDDVAFVFEVNL